MVQDAVFLWHALTVRRRQGIFPSPLGDLEGEAFLDVPETLFHKLKSHMGLEHTRHRSPSNALVHIFSCLAAYTLAQPKVKMGPVVMPDPAGSLIHNLGTYIR